MADHDNPRAVAWERFPGGFSKLSRVQPCSPTLGVAPDRCDCCENRHILVACIAEEGVEVSLALNAKTAVEVANAILSAVYILHPELRGLVE